jgi:hypothetical protein
MEGPGGYADRNTGRRSALLVDDMRNKTLWESICDRSGKDGQAEVNVAEAVGASAVNEAIGEVEIRRFLEDGLIVQSGDGTIRLTDAGRNSCSQIHHSPLSVTDVASDPNDASTVEMPQR